MFRLLQYNYDSSTAVCVIRWTLFSLCNDVDEYNQHEIAIGFLVLVHLPRQHPFGTTLSFTGPVPADSRQ